MSLSQLLVGPAVAADGTNPVARGGRDGDAIVSQLHGRLYEQAMRGNLFTAGMVGTSISNATFTVATVDATATPIIGIWNPANSGYNAVILQAYLGVNQSALQATGCGAFTWMACLNNSAISTGITPFSTKTLAATGSVMKAYANTALTGKSTSLALLRGSTLCGGSGIGTAFLATQAGAQAQQTSSVENIDGSIIVPPGGVLGLFCNTTPVGHSATSGLLWEEVPV